MTVKYDLHIHSCLSPCADDSLTPATAAGFAALEGIQIAALTDHNCSLNCAAFERAGAEYGIATLCGMELTTSEDIHVVCLFRTAAEAVRFNAYVEERRPSYANKPLIYGSQLIVDENDRVMGEYPRLLHVASYIGFNEARAVVYGFGGAAIPAHINREANSALPILGAIPPEPGYRVFERLYSLPLKDGDVPDGSLVLTDSDAHTASMIGCANGVLELPDSEDIASAALAYLRNFPDINT